MKFRTDGSLTFALDPASMDMNKPHQLPLLILVTWVALALLAFSAHRFYLYASGSAAQHVPTHAKQPLAACFTTQPATA